MSLDWDKYVVGFVFGVAIGVAVTSPTKEVPQAVEEKIQMEEKYVPQVIPFQEGTPHEVISIQQLYKPTDKNDKTYSSR